MIEKYEDVNNFLYRLKKKISFLFNFFVWDRILNLFWELMIGLFGWFNIVWLVMGIFLGSVK